MGSKPFLEVAHPKVSQDIFNLVPSKKPEPNHCPCTLKSKVKSSEIGTFFWGQDQNEITPTPWLTRIRFTRGPSVSHETNWKLGIKCFFRKIWPHCEKRPPAHFSSPTWSCNKRECALKSRMLYMLCCFECKTVFLEI